MQELNAVIGKIVDTIQDLSPLALPLARGGDSSIKSSGLDFN
jgi:hypothetical protein